MDEDLRFWYAKCAVASLPCSMTELIEQVIESLDAEFVKYFALGRHTRRADELGEDFDDRHPLEAAALERGFTMIGSLSFDDEGWVASSGPVYRFHDYGLESYPRPVVIPGPHPIATCECLACARPRSKDVH